VEVLRRRLGIERPPDLREERKRARQKRRLAREAREAREKVGVDGVVR
jgi:ubiquinone biosynthesis protein COQ4